MAMINPVVLRAVCKACPHESSLDEWAVWVSAEMDKIARLTKWRRDIEVRNRSIEQAQDYAKKGLISLQRACSHLATKRHERPNAEYDSWEECIICGKVIA